MKVFVAKVLFIIIEDMRAGSTGLPTAIGINVCHKVGTACDLDLLMTGAIEHMTSIQSFVGV